MVGRISRFALLLFPLGLLTSCGSTDGGVSGTTGSGAPAAVMATATFVPKAATNTGGMMTFTQDSEGVTMVVVVTGLAPGKHGLHLHEKGECSEPDFATAGEHFNPDGQPHACPPEMSRHAGDFGNIEVGADGTGRMQLRTDRLTLDSGPNSAVGRAVIIHDMADDCTTQPSGGSGVRLGCAIVKLAQQ